ncbi:hypothetical protein [Chitinophaga sp. Cy-1792]|uniref:hypothetical protein n=1 Tax=Chitinophaga sp. Cy-1792 TaxID=2608339 RepID=UPI00141EDF41|nr:hypothetical protein [Chitinophaga sp. Cy-1792]NIG52326.1 hypothetical protein [Chitinophaga sp. Cy-1792]
MKLVLAPKVKMILTAAALLGSLNVMAQENDYAFGTAKMTTAVTENGSPKAAVNMQLTQLNKDGITFNLAVENPSNEKLVLYIKDKNNFTLHREILPTTVRYAGSYNLDSLEDGDYTFEIRSGKNKLVEKTVGIHTSTVVNRNVSVEK